MTKSDDQAAQNLRDRAYSLIRQAGLTPTCTLVAVIIDQLRREDQAIEAARRKKCHELA